MNKFAATVVLLLAMSVPAEAQYGTTGKTYLGSLSSNPFAADSISNPFGRYGSPYAPDSLRNPYGRYGNPYSSMSASNPYTLTAPVVISHDGSYLGRLSANRFDPDSITNPFGRYGSPYSSESINNPYGRYGSPYSSNSFANPFASNPPRIYGDAYSGIRYTGYGYTGHSGYRR